MRAGGQIFAQFWSSTYFPLEVAVAKRTEIARLLISLGFPLNIPLSYSSWEPAPLRGPYPTILDCVRFLSTEVERAKRPLVVFDRSFSNDAPPSDDPGPAWKAKVERLILDYEGYQHKASTAGKTSGKEPTYPDEMKAYYDGLADLIQTRMSQSDEPRVTFGVSGNCPQRLKDLMFPLIERESDPNIVWHTDPVFHRYSLGARADLCPLYEELYTACWEGDNDTIQRLCLPRPEQRSSVAHLQISVYWGQSNTGTSSGVSGNNYSLLIGL